VKAKRAKRGVLSRRKRKPFEGGITAKESKLINHMVTHLENNELKLADKKWDILMGKKAPKSPRTTAIRRRKKSK